MNQKICFVSPYATPLFTNKNGGSGGAEKQFYLFGKNLALNGYDVSFIIEKTDIVVNSNWAKLKKVDFSFLGGSKLKIFKSFIELFYSFIQLKPDLIILKTAHILFVPIFFYCLVFRKKFIFWGQTDTDFNLSKDNEPSIIEKCRHLGIRKALYIIVQNSFQKEQLLKNFNRSSKRISNIIEPEIKQRNKLNENIILWIGNSSHNKGFENLIRLSKYFPQHKFVVAMNVADLELFTTYKTNCSNIKNITFLGSLPNNKLNEFYNKAYALINTSIREGFPNTYLEAWNYGVPVFSLQIDPDNVIMDNNLGYCSSKNENMDKFTLLKENLKNIIDEPNKRKIMSNNCKSYLEKNHYPAKVIPLLVNLIEKHYEK